MVRCETFNVYQTVGREVDTRVVHTVSTVEVQGGPEKRSRSTTAIRGCSVRLASCGSTKVALRSRSGHADLFGCQFLCDQLLLGFS